MEKPKTKEGTTKSHDKTKDSPVSSRWFYLGFGLLFGALLGVVSGLEVINERAKFIAANVASALALLVIVIQTGIYRRQREVMEGQWKENTAAVELMKSQLTAMRAQDRTQNATLEAMKQQAKIMDRQLVLGTRAYVGVNSIVFDTHRKRIFLQVENIGKVPAKNVDVTVELIVRIPDHHMPPANPDGKRPGWGFRKVEHGIKTGVDPEMVDYWELRIPKLQPYGSTKLFPGSLKLVIPIRLDEILYISQAQYQSITSGHAKVLVRGFILYSDGFHSGKKTEFAFRYYLRDNLWVPMPDTGFEHYAPEPEKPDSDYDPN